MLGTIVKRSPASLCGHSIDTLLTPGGQIFYQTHLYPLLRINGHASEVYISLQAADGTVVPVLLNGVRREEADGHVSDLVFIRVEQRNKLENELLQAKRAAEEASEAKNRLISILSHDLRAPLSTIIMGADMLATGLMGELDDRPRRQAENIFSTGQYVLRLVDDILHFAQLESNQVVVRLKPVAVADVLGEVAAMVEHLLQEADLEFTVDTGPKNMEVLADPDRLQQVLLNLITNARKFTDAGGRISLRAGRLEDTVWVKVKDSGCGIPADQQEHIFAPFTQLQLATNRTRGDGVGLGLSISREFARLMEGKLTVKSVEGEGSTFTVELQAA